MSLGIASRMFVEGLEEKSVTLMSVAAGITFVVFIASQRLLENSNETKFA